MLVVMHRDGFAFPHSWHFRNADTRESKFGKETQEHGTEK